MKTNWFDTWKEISEMSCSSGDEKQLSEYLTKQYSEISDDIIYDNLGSIYAVKKANTKSAPNVMISGHLDEVGFIIKKIHDNGKLQCLCLGNHIVSQLGASKVQLVKNDQHYIGMIVSMDSDKTFEKNSEVLIDLGFTSKSEVDTLEIELGDYITFYQELEVSGNNKVIYSKAISRTYGLVLGIELLKALKGETVDFNLYVGGTTQNKVGVRGAQTATNLVKPDMANTLDFSPSFEENKDKDYQGKIGNGILLTFYNVKMLPNKMLLNDLKKTCDENEIPYQYYYSMDEGDEGWIHKLRVGAPTLSLNIAGQNLNLNISNSDIDDINHAILTLKYFVLNLNQDKIEAYKTDNR